MFRCKYCFKQFKTRQEAVAHVIEEHGEKESTAKSCAWKMTPRNGNELWRKYNYEKQARREDIVRYICQHGSYFPSGACYCPICHSNHSKSYHVYLIDDDGHHSITLCRNCYKALTAERPQSVYHKSIYDGDYEASK